MVSQLGSGPLRYANAARAGVIEPRQILDRTRQGDRCLGPNEIRERTRGAGDPTPRSETFGEREGGIATDVVVHEEGLHPAWRKVLPILGDRPKVSA